MKALVLGGGGSRSAWTCGVLKHLLGDCKINYSIITGISSGAINAAYLAQFNKNQEQEAANTLESLWRKLTTEKIYRHWKIPYVSALWRHSLFDSFPLEQMLTTGLDFSLIKNSDKHVIVGAVNVNTGHYHLFTKHDAHFIKGVVASASFPSFLSPVKIDDEYYFDGGSAEALPIKPAIDFGATEIDLIMTSPEHKNNFFVAKPNILDIFKRTIDVSFDKILANDIERIEYNNVLAMAGISNKKLIKLNIYRPSKNLSKNLLDFDPEKIAKMIDLGYEEAKVQHQLIYSNKE